MKQYRVKPHDHTDHLFNTGDLVIKTGRRLPGGRAEYMGESGVLQWLMRDQVECIGGGFDWLKFTFALGAVFLTLLAILKPFLKEWIQQALAIGGILSLFVSMSLFYGEIHKNR